MNRARFTSRLSVPLVLSIRTRLLLFLALSVILTALAISVVTAVLGFGDARDRVVAQLKSVVTLKEQEILTWTDGLALNLDIVLSETGLRVDLAALAARDDTGEVQAEAYARVYERFNWASKRMGLFEELFFMDREGVVIISTNAGHEGQRLGLNDFFIQGKKADYLQEPSYSLSLAKMTVVASKPVEREGRFLGVIAGRADLEGLNRIMIERAGLGEKGETYLVGSNYRLLTHLRRPGYSIPNTYIRTPGTDAVVGLRQAGSDTYEGYGGATVIGVYEWIPELRVGLVAEQEQAEALAATRLVLITMGGVAALAAAFAILAGIALTRRIVRPLGELSDTAGRIAAGDLDRQAEVVREDEIGALAHSFNSMTAQLRTLVRSLERRTDHLRAINESGRQISSILELNELLPYVARSLVDTFAYDSVRILLLTGDHEGRLLTCDQRGTCQEDSFLAFDEAAAAPAVVAAARTGEPQLLPPSAAGGGAPQQASGPSPHEPSGPIHAGAQRSIADRGLYNEIAVPIIIREDLLGVLDLTSSAHLLDEQDLFAARTLADQLAVAIENSRLYEHARELAATHERQRLARDLHDAVSQTLFSVSLIAEVLPRIYERDSEQGAQRLEELRVLTRGALAEMRTLLLELRPAALAEANLPDLLRQLSEGTFGRARIPVEVDIDGGCEAMTPQARVALYRIAQEALNNVAKHSGASRARLALACEGGSVQLVVTDDGSGFDINGLTGGQLGLGIMRERAETIGATLSVSSVPGEGTTVSVTWTPAEAPV